MTRSQTPCVFCGIECNRTWMEALESKVRPVLQPMLLGARAGTSIVLDPRPAGGPCHLGNCLNGVLDDLRAGAVTRSYEFLAGLAQFHPGGGVIAQVPAD